MKFSLIIPTKDRKDILNKTLRHLKEVTNLKDIEIIIINDSEQPVQINNEALAAEVHVHKNPTNGVANGRNFGASMASNDWLVFMDDDMLVQRDTFQKLISFCDPDKDQCFNVNWVYPDEVILKRSRLPFLRYLHKYGFDSLEGWSTDVEWNHTEVFQVKRITSQFLMIHKSVFHKSGGYNASFPYAGFEDHELSGRLNTLGIRVFLDPLNMIFHNEEDRLEVESFLERKKRGAITRRVAVNLGHRDLDVPYNFLKRTIYRLVFSCRKMILYLLRKWPQTRKLDKLYFLLINILFGAYTFIGFTQEDKK